MSIWLAPPPTVNGEASSMFKAFTVRMDVRSSVVMKPVPTFTVSVIPAALTSVYAPPLLYAVYAVIPFAP